VSSRRREPAAKLALFLAAVFVVKLIVALQLDKHPLLQPDTGLDTTAYVELAKRVVAGDFALGPGLYYVSPLYIYFLAVVYGATRSFTAARVMQELLGTISIAFIFMTARAWFGRRAAWIAAGLAALTGVFTYYEGLILQSSLDAFLTSAALWLLTLAVTRDERRFPLLAGVAFGAASLNRPNMIVPAVATVCVLFALRRFRTAAIVLAGVIAGLAPVTIRNLAVAHQWSLVSSHGGINFYIGNGEGATGYFHAVPGMRSTVEGLAIDARRVSEAASRRKLTDAEVSSYYSSLAWTWIRNHPAAWALLLLRKTFGLFNAAHVSTPFSYVFYAYDAGTLLRFLFVGPWLLVPLGAFGLVRAAPRPWNGAYVAWLSFAPAYAASVVLFFITERYNLPLHVALAIGAGAGADSLLADFHARRTRQLAASGCVLALLFIGANWPLHLDDGRAEERARMAESMLGRGEIEQAERWARLAVASSPDRASARAEYVLGRVLLAAGRSADAVVHLRRAIDDHVDVPLAGYDLAVAVQQTGDLAGAARALRAVNPPVDSPVVVWLQLARRAAEINAPDVAEPFLRKAVAVAPKLAQAHRMLAIDLLALGRFEEAAGEFTTTLRFEPRNPDALAMLAYCEQHLGRVRDAREHAQAALAIAPAHPIARQVMGGLGGMR
jgi:tetratricopeptide (TPR) repeat protein